MTGPLLRLRNLWPLAPVLSVLVGSCGGDNLVASAPMTAGWTWVSGSSSSNQSGVYGTQGTASPSSVPGARERPVSWIDAAGNLWLFGGSGVDPAGSFSRLSDLWRFDGTNWTWVSGSSDIRQAGVYGTQGTASPSNIPGARESSVSWIDAAGNLWLFGGVGYDAAGTFARLNDLWRYNR